MNDNINVVLDHIHDRTNFPRYSLSLRNILYKVGMESYLSLCIRRLQNAELIDGDEIKQRLNPDDIILSSEGVLKCYDIISGYIDDEHLEECAHGILYLEKYAEHMNHMLETLRDIPTKELKKLAKNKIKPNDEKQDFCHQCLIAELESRSLRNKLRLFLR